MRDGEQDKTLNEKKKEYKKERGKTAAQNTAYPQVPIGVPDRYKA